MAKVVAMAIVKAMVMGQCHGQNHSHVQTRGQWKVDSNSFQGRLKSAHGPPTVGHSPTPTSHGRHMVGRGHARMAGLGWSSPPTASHAHVARAGYGTQGPIKEFQQCRKRPQHKAEGAGGTFLGPKCSLVN